MQIVVDGMFQEADRPAVAATSRGLMYGEGCFETFRSYRGHTLLLEDHLARLQGGLDVLGLSLPEGLRADALRPLLGDLLARNRLLDGDAIVRLQVWREGGRGYGSGAAGRPHFSLLTSECPREFPPPRLVTVERRRIPSEALPAEFKFTNGINYILAAREARRKGGDDALMQTVDGRISETPIANIFWLKGGAVYTPSPACDILPGITRKALITLLREKGVKLQEGSYPLGHLMDAELICLCNSVREVLPVRAIDGRGFENAHYLAEMWQELFREYRNRHLQSLEQ